MVPRSASFKKCRVRASRQIAAGVRREESPPRAPRTGLTYANARASSQSAPCSTWAQGCLARSCPSGWTEPHPSLLGDTRELQRLSYEPVGNRMPDGSSQICVVDLLVDTGQARSTRSGIVGDVGFEPRCVECATRTPVQQRCSRNAPSPECHETQQAGFAAQEPTTPEEIHTDSPLNFTL